MDLKRDHIRFGTCRFLVGKRHFLPRTKYHQTPQGVFGWVWPFGPPTNHSLKKPWVACFRRSPSDMEGYLPDQEAPSSRTANHTTPNMITMNKQLLRLPVVDSRWIASIGTATKKRR